LLRQGWALRDAGKPAEAATAFRSYLGAPASAGGSGSERDWAELGLVLSAIGSAGWNAAAQPGQHAPAPPAPLAPPAPVRPEAARLRSRSASPRISLPSH